MTKITLKGNPIHTNGELPAVGSIVPDFVLVDKDLAEVTLKRHLGKKTVMLIVPSLDTAVCGTMTQRFSESIKKNPEVAACVISADLPFAQKRFCFDNSIENIHTLSTMRGQQFARDYGVLITDGPLAGLCARAVLVLDQEGKVVYSELVPEVTDEPNYDAALAILLQ